MDRANRVESVASIFNLVDACNRCSLVFRLASELYNNDDFRALSGKTQQMLDRFSYELQTEVRRIDGSDFGPPRSYSENAQEPESLVLRCETLLQSALKEFELTLNTQLTAHTRAMLKRQQLQIQQAYDQIVQLRRAA